MARQLSPARGVTVKWKDVIVGRYELAQILGEALGIDNVVVTALCQ
jgi:hypothetical protein